MPKVSVLDRKHPAYYGDYWRRCDLFYRGGRALLESDVLAEVYPPHREETEKVYAERLRLAFYINEVAKVTNKYLGRAFSQPVTMEAEPKPDAFYQDFHNDVSAPGGQRVSLAAYLKLVGLDALKYGRAWTLAALPKPMGTPRSLAEQERAGALRASLSCVDPACVYNWRKDATGSITWAVVHSEENPLETFDADEKIVERWTVYTQAEWIEYVLERKPDEKRDPEKELAVNARGTHTFRRVPLVELELPEGLWALSKLEPIAREILCSLNGLSWQQRNIHFPTLYEFLGPEAQRSTDRAVSEVQKDPARAKNQNRGPGWGQVRGQDDDAKFVAPDPAGLDTGLRYIDRLLTALNEVMDQISATAQSTSTALGRSGDSKEEDRESATPGLRDFASLVKEHSVEIHECVAVGRGDPEAEWTAKGMNRFDDISASRSVADGVNLAAVNIPSPTFQTEMKMGIVEAVLGDKATPEMLVKIRGELDQGHTLDQKASEKETKRIIDGADSPRGEIVP